MPVSRSNKPRKAAKRAAKRARRKIVGARSAKTGRFVPLSKLKTAPASTVAVTREEIETEFGVPPDRT